MPTRYARLETLLGVKGAGLALSRGQLLSKLLYLRLLLLNSFLVFELLSFQSVLLVLQLLLQGLDS